MKKALLVLSIIFSTTLAYCQRATVNPTQEYSSALINEGHIPEPNGQDTSIVFSSEILKKRLTALDAETPMNVVYNATMERFVRLYIKTRKDAISNLIDKSHYYFPIFESYLDKYDLPLEIKYLAVVESALEASAKSSAGAKGIWQIMYLTGKQYNLNVTSYVDDRADVLKATRAACEYLKYLYDRFNDWDLALAAYNAGPGNVSKAIKKSGGKRNYWNIRKYLPKETRSYIPAFYATLYLFKYGKKHNIHPKNTQINFHQTDTVVIKEQITFNEIKQRTGINDALLRFLNPQYKLAIIPASQKAIYTLALPKYLVKKFENNRFKMAIAESNAIERATYTIPTKFNSYIVQEGDNLQRIAKKFNISIHTLKQWNGLESDYIIKDQRLVVTQYKDTGASIDTTLPTSKNITMYVVKEGDSLWKISKKFANVSINNLRNWNEIWGVNYVEPGTVLKILTD